MSDRKHEHLYTSEQKLSWWGNGEWVEEEDLVTWEYKGIKCRAIRLAFPEGPKHFFGGYLCGYVQIPKNHPWNYSEWDEIDCEVHGGITYKDEEPGGFVWIGFDCAHSHDVVPSMADIKKKVVEKTKLMCRGLNLDIENSTIFISSYKNIAFCIEQCESMVDQMLGEPLDDNSPAADIGTSGSDNDSDSG